MFIECIRCIKQCLNGYFYYPFVSVDPYLSNFGEKLKNTLKNCHFENLIKLKKYIWIKYLRYVILTFLLTKYMIWDSWVIFDMPIHPNPEKLDFEPGLTKKIVTQKEVILVFFLAKMLISPPKMMKITI